MKVFAIVIGLHAANRSCAIFAAQEMLKGYKRAHPRARAAVHILSGKPGNRCIKILTTLDLLH